MGKSDCASDYGDGPAAAHSTVFVDSSLDTHLAMIVSDVETVSDFKNRILFEHRQCFPHIGEIKIHALKVKRKGFFYNLSDSMLVKCVFDGVKKNWFLFLDASNTTEKGEPQYFVAANVPSKELSISKDSSLQQFGKSQHEDNHCWPSSSNTSRRLELEMPENRKPIDKELNVLGRYTESKRVHSKDGIAVIQYNDSAKVELRSASVENKKRKRKKKKKKKKIEAAENMVPDHADAVMKLRSTHIDDEPCSTQTPKACSKIPQNCVPTVGNDTEYIKESPGETSASHSKRKRKHGIEEGKHSESYLDEGSTLTSKHAKLTSDTKADVLSNSSKSVSRRKNTVVNGSYIEASAGVLSLGIGSGSKKKKHRTNSKSTHDQLAFSVPFENVSSEFNASDNPGKIIQSTGVESCSKFQEEPPSNSVREEVGGGSHLLGIGSGSRKKKHRMNSENTHVQLSFPVPSEKFSSEIDAANNPEQVVQNAGVKSCLEFQAELPSNSIQEVVPADVNLLGKGLVNRKKKCRTDSKKEHDQLASPVPSGKFWSESNATNDPGKIAESAEVKSCSEFQEESPSIIVQEVVEGDELPCFPLGASTKEPNAGNLESRSDATEPVEASLAKQVRNSKADPEAVAPSPVKDAGEKERLQNPESTLSERCEPEKGFERVAILSEPNVSTGSRNSSGRRVKSRAKNSHANASTVSRMSNLDSSPVNGLETADACGNEGEEELQEAQVAESRKDKTDMDGNQTLTSNKHGDVSVGGLSGSPPQKEHENSVFSDDKLKKTVTPSQSTKKGKEKKKGSTTDSKLELPHQGTNFDPSQNPSSCRYSLRSSRLKPSSKAEQPNEESGFVLAAADHQRNSRSAGSSQCPSSDISHDKKSESKVARALPATEVSKIQESAENMDTRGKNSNHKVVVSEVFPASPMKENSIHSKDKVVSNDRERKKGAPRSTRTTRPKDTNVTTGSSLENTCKDAETELVDSIHQNINGDGSQERNHDVKAAGNENSKEVSMHEGGEVNFNVFFLPGQSRNEADPTKALDKVSTARGLDREHKAEKGSNVTTAAITHNLQPLHSSYEQRNLSEEDCTARGQPEKPLPDSSFSTLSNKKPSNDSGFDSRQPTSENVGVGLAPGEFIAQNVIHPSASPSRKPDSNESDKNSLVAATKHPRKNLIQSLNSPEHEKSLVSRAASIFNDHSSESSEDESSEDKNLVQNSDATQTPDNVSSSGFSGESEGSPDNGGNVTKEKGHEKKDSKNSMSSPLGGKSMGMGMLLRCSSRYKMAMLQASSQDPEADSIDSVPESEPIQ